MNIQEIKAVVETFSSDLRQELTAYLVSSRHKELGDDQSEMAQKIDGWCPEQWVSLEEFDQRLKS